LYFGVSQFPSSTDDGFTRERLVSKLNSSLVLAGIWFAGQTEISLAFFGAAVLFLPLFVFMPKLIQYAMKADADAAIEAFGKNEQIKKVFWTLFVAMAGLVMARVVDPVTAQQVVGMITGMGV
jgi:F0F1-type ATP synthase assembly protein I